MNGRTGSTGRAFGARRSILLVCLLHVLVAIPLYAQDRPAAQPADAASAANGKDEDPQQQLVYQAAELANQQQTAEALAKVEQALEGYQARFADEKRSIYSARDPKESLLYMAQAANAKTSAVAVGFEYGFAWYLRGYLLVELKRYDEALAALRKAAELSPMNAQYQSELGNLYQERRDWPAALAAYRSARGASEFSPEETKRQDEGRALRGQGFVLIETGDLDGAEVALKQALALDPDDRRAKEELDYIRQIRKKGTEATKRDDAPI